MQPSTCGTKSARLRTCAIVLASLVALLGCQSFGLGGARQQTFAKPNEAVDALFTGLETDDQSALLSIFGRKYEDEIVTEDWEADREMRATIAREGRLQHELSDVGDDTLELVIGKEDWPFPMPLVQDGRRWRFDTAAGIQELVDRRVGRNELAAVAIAHAYVDAQIEYASQDRDGDGLREYAQKLASTDGQQDGLYWETAEGDAESPLGPLVASSERYLATREPGDPLRGYYFEILTQQGASPPGGARSYLAGDDMLTGFALVAYPAEHGNTGIMTFVVNHRGQVYEKDLGGKTDVDAYDPGEGWVLVEE